MSFEGRRQLRPGEDGWESLRLLVERQLCGLNQQQGKETAAEEEAPEGRSKGGGKAASVAARPRPPPVIRYIKKAGWVSG